MNNSETQIADVVRREAFDADCREPEYDHTASGSSCRSVMIAGSVRPKAKSESNETLRQRMQNTLSASEETEITC